MPRRFYLNNFQKNIVQLKIMKNHEKIKIQVKEFGKRKRKKHLKQVL
jgi:hypothetical protein